MPRCYLRLLLTTVSLSLMTAFFGPAISAVCAAGPPPEESRSAPLAGIQTVGLSVAPKLADPNLNSRLLEQIQPVAEKRLASCAIRMTAADAADSTGQPVLAITISQQHAANGGHIEVALNLMDRVRSARGQDQLLRVSTWEKHSNLSTSADKEEITNHATALLDSFIADYVLANPMAAAAVYLQSSGGAYQSNAGASTLRGMPQVESPVLLNGNWDSTYGIVTLHQAERDAKGLIPVSGYWMDANAGKRGEIQIGKFDPKTRTLTFTFFMPWKKKHGKAVVTLSADGRTLDGIKKAGGVHKWRWTMWR